jgi:hypothetical protein
MSSTFRVKLNDHDIISVSSLTSYWIAWILNAVLLAGNSTLVESRSSFVEAPARLILPRLHFVYT